MKANEAPEKIYLQDSMSTDTIGELWPEWFDAKVSDDSIEYTRTDAFIEKAENFFTETFDVEDYNDILDVDGSPIFNYCRFIEEFINYVKGE